MIFRLKPEATIFGLKPEATLNLGARHGQLDDLLHELRIGAP